MSKRQSAPSIRQEARTTADIAQARTATTTSILFTIVVGLVFSLFFAHRLTVPLIRLTAQVRNIRAGGDLNALADASVSGRGDEIGALSRSFNQMIIELAAARDQLLARSEINKQYERLDLAINSMPQGLCMFDADQKNALSSPTVAIRNSMAWRRKNHSRHRPPDDVE